MYGKELHKKLQFFWHTIQIFMGFGNIVEGLFPVLWLWFYITGEERLLCCLLNQTFFSIVIIIFLEVGVFKS